MFRLHFHVDNNGDGSVSVRFHDTQKAAQRADDNMSEGWGESSVGSVDLDIVDGRIIRRCRHWEDDKLITELKPLEIVK